MNKKILALDLSLTSTGVAYRTEDSVYVGHLDTSKKRSLERLAFIADTVGGILFNRIVECDMLAIEGPAFGFKQMATRSHSLGELHGAIKLLAWEEEIDILVVPPSTLKKFVTGNGAAKKPEVIAAVQEVWGFATTQDDEADAYGLLMLGEAYTDARKRRRYDSVRRAALSGCEIIR